jgi:hypothetical protein
VRGARRDSARVPTTTAAAVLDFGFGGAFGACVCISLTATAASNPLCVCAGVERGAGGGGGSACRWSRSTASWPIPFILCCGWGEARVAGCRWVPGDGLTDGGERLYRK